MPPLPLLTLPDEAAYRAHFEREYVLRGSVVTFDGIAVDFFPEVFDHAFFRDSSRTAKDKARFDRERAERMDWIRAVLQEPSAEVYRGVMPSGKIHRIALLLPQRYAVVVQMRSGRRNRARFLTAYVVDSDSALAKMRRNPKW